MQLRRLFSKNIKARRTKMRISQEKLAELAGLSVQMVNSVEGCRAWISDKTLVSLAKALGVEVYQLFSPLIEEETRNSDFVFVQSLTKLKNQTSIDRGYTGSNNRANECLGK